MTFFACVFSSPPPQAVSQMHSLGNINVPSSQTALWLRAVLFSKRRSMFVGLFVLVFLCLIVICRRGRPVCLPEDFFACVFRAHTSVRPYIVCPCVLLSYCLSVGADRCVCPVSFYLIHLLVGHIVRRSRINTILFNWLNKTQQ